MAAAFSYQAHHSDECLLDSSVVFQSFPIDISEILEELNNSSTSLNCCSHEYSNSQQQLAVNVSVQESSNNESSMTNKSSSSIILEMDSSSSVITSRMKISKESVTPMNRKRNSNTREGSSSMTFSQSEKIREADHGKKPRKSKDYLTKEVNEKKGMSEDKKEAPTGYIFVRAKRGQATDSHSLAERVRREKISERMKTLQFLVPGCDMVTGKAQMLDEIINYVQSLKNQVEILSMKLASLDPMYYDLGGGGDLDAITIRNDQQYCNPNNTNGGYPLLDSLTFQQSHIPYSISQVDGQLLSGVDDERQMFINQSGFSNNLYSFH